MMVHCCSLQSCCQHITSHVSLVSLVKCEVVIGGTPDETFDVLVK